MMQSVPIFDTRPQYQALKSEMDAAVAGVLERGWYIQGEEHRAFEAEFASYCEARHALGVASGTDAIRIALQAVGVQPGDEVITVANAGVPPVAAVVEAGATPVFADVDPSTYTLDPGRIADKITDRTKTVLAVHLYGHPVDVGAILAVLHPRGIKLVEDCAQAHGARYKGQRVGGLGDAAAFSFYPTKNLGAYGDGGCITTNDDTVAEQARLLRVYGWRTRYLSEQHGINSRLDELQAAILRVKLRHLDASNEQRRRRAEAYGELLRGVGTPATAPWAEPVYHLYVVETDDRDRLRAGLAERGVGSDVHYPLPTHLQPAYQSYGSGEGALPVTERLSNQVLSLPIFPELPLDSIDYVARQVSELATSQTR